MVVAAVVLSPLRRVAGVRDSKKLTPASREALALEIRATALKYAVIVVDHEEVDRLNILAATLEGMRRAVESLDLRPALVLVDGNRLPEVDAEEGVRWRAVVKGDDRFASIAAASILAKVERDRIMVQLDLRYPGYGFAAHKGYPTVQHRRALVAMGPCPVHRRSFRLDYRS